jgi:subtilisin family serine protease
MSGTSMASSHVAGVIALIIGQRGNMTPAKMKELLKSMATLGALKNAESLNPSAPNIMLYIDKSI